MTKKKYIQCDLGDRIDFAPHEVIDMRVYIPSDMGNVLTYFLQNMPKDKFLHCKQVLMSEADIEAEKEHDRIYRRLYERIHPHVRTISSHRDRTKGWNNNKSEHVPYIDCWDYWE